MCQLHADIFDRSYKHTFIRLPFHVWSSCIVNSFMENTTVFRPITNIHLGVITYLDEEEFWTKNFGLPDIGRTSVTFEWACKE